MNRDNARPPRYATRLLAWCLPDNDAAYSILGDLHELYQSRPQYLRHIWYWANAIGIGMRYIPTKLATGDPARAWFRGMASPVRQLTREPAFFAFATITLALGIGANAGVFSVVWHARLKPLPFDNVDRLVRLGSATRESSSSRGGSMSELNLRDLAAASRQFAVVGGFRLTSVALAGEAPAQQVLLAQVTPAILDSMGTTATLGRGLTDRDAGQDVVVLSHDTWAQTFASDPAVIGGTIEVDRLSHRIVGVLPAELTWPGAPAVWKTLSFVGLSETTHPRRRRSVEAIGVLAAGSTIEGGLAELNRVFDDMRQAYPDANGDRKIVGLPLPDYFIYGSARTLVMFATISVLVLVIACVNVIHLMLVRSEKRHREYAVRAAIGANRTQLAALLLGDAVVVAGLAVAAGTIGSRWLTDVIVSLLGRSLPRAESIAVSWETVAFASIVAVVCAIAVAAVPAIRLELGNLQSSLREGSRGTSRSATLRRTLVGVQIALSVAVATSAGLMLRTVSSLRNFDLGYDTSGVVVAEVPLPSSAYPSAQARQSFYDELLNRLEARAGIVEAGVSNRQPLLPGRNGTVTVSGTQPGDEPLVELREIRGRTLPVLGIPLLQGVDLTASSDPRSALVNSEFVRQVLQGNPPIGMQFTTGRNSEPWSIVGVVGDVLEGGPEAGALPTAYFPYNGNLAQMTLVVRTDGPPLNVVPQIRATVAEMDASVPITDIATLSDLALNAGGRDRITAAVLFSILAATAFLLGSIGVYGVVSYSVEQRQREFGIRVALGSGNGSIARLVLGETLAVAGVGVLVGGLLAIGSAIMLDTLLFGVQRFDAISFVSAAGLLATAAVAASVLPLLRALRTSPLVVLRAE